MNEETMLRAQDRKINWYPGHMARAKRLLTEQLSRVDAVVELCDARIPRASRNPDLGKLIAGKRHLLVLGKAVRPGNLGTLDSFAHIAATVTDLLGVDFQTPGRSIADRIL